MMNYREIYLNLISEKFPEKLKDPKILWKLDHLNSAVNVIALNELLFYNGNKSKDIADSRLRSYTEAEIIKILKYQIKYNKSNSDIIAKYGMTASTLITWKKKFENNL